MFLVQFPLLLLDCLSGSQGKRSQYFPLWESSIPFLGKMRYGWRQKWEDRWVTMKNLISTHLVSRQVEALSLDCTTDSDRKKCYSAANDSVGKMYTTVFPNAINVCLHLKSQLLSLIKSSLLLRCQRCKWCSATQAWGTLMRRDISNSALLTKWFMLCDEPLSVYSILNPDCWDVCWERIHATHICTQRHWHVCFSSNCRRD